MIRREKEKQKKNHDNGEYTIFQFPMIRAYDNFLETKGVQKVAASKERQKMAEYTKHTKHKNWEFVAYMNSKQNSAQLCLSLSMTATNILSPFQTHTNTPAMRFQLSPNCWDTI